MLNLSNRALTTHFIDCTKAIFEGGAHGVCLGLIYLDLIQKWAKSSLGRLVEELCLREVLVDVASVY